LAGATGAGASKAGVFKATAAGLGAAAVGGSGNITTGAGSGLLGNTNVGCLICCTGFGARGRSEGSVGATNVACSTNRRTSGEDAQTVPINRTAKQCSRILARNARRGEAAGSMLKFTSQPQNPK
jgi:hypothetical protein